VEEEENVKILLLKREKLVELIKIESEALQAADEKNKAGHAKLLKLKRIREKANFGLKKKSEKIVHLSRNIERLRNIEMDFMNRLESVNKVWDKEMEGIKF